MTNRDVLLDFRPEFPILENTVYLISNSLGAMPRSAEAALAEFTQAWRTRGVRAWGDSWWDLSATVGDEIAPLLDAPSGSVTMHPNVTTAQAIVATSFDYRTGRSKIVMAEGDFPSVRYVYENLAARLGARVEVVASPDGGGLSADEEAIAAAVDDETALVVLSHVLFKSAFIVDLSPIVEKAERVGALVVADVFQSLGTIPFSVRQARIPIVVGGVLKWLCGGPGGAFLYVAPEIRSAMRPALTGWFAHRRPFAFEDEQDLRDDAHRFLLGTPAIPALYAAREGPRLIRRAGVDRIRAKSLVQTARIAELAVSRGFRVSAPSEPERRGGTVAVDFPNALEVSRELNERNVCVDFRPGAGIRLSPHFYTADDEIGEAFAQIDAILAEGAWRRWERQSAIVT